jgi:hypothetical protein
VPSSMIFAGLVVIWLLILLPAVARHRQEVARPSEAALAGRVLDRPRRPDPEVDDLADTRTERAAASDMHVPHARAAADDDRHPDDRTWDRPPPRYRPGRGGYDAQAAAAAARARAAFRQRVVLTLLLAAIVSGVVAAAAIPYIWWAHGAVDLALVGYLCYLRRQVRMEAAIRERRAARMAGSRRPTAADEPEPDDQDRRAAPEPAAEPVDHVPADEPADDPDDLLREEPERVPGTGAPLPRIVTSLDELTVESALPRLEPAPPPPLPAGTVLVEELEDDPDQHELGAGRRSDYRRAAGE